MKVAGIPLRRFTSISLANSDQAVDIVNLEHREVMQLTQEKLDELWSRLVELSKDDDTFHDLIADKTLELKNNNLFHIHVSNLYFDSQFRNYQMRILDFLRKETGNEQLQFKVVVVYEKTERKAYLPNEKFDEMASRNPSMYNLRKLFPNIDF